MTTATLPFEQRPTRVDVEEVWLRPGLGAHELRIQLTVHAPWLPNEPADAGAVLHLHADVDVDVANRQGPLGQANATYTVRNYATRETVSVILTDQQLHALEEPASRDGLTLQLDLTGTLLAAALTEHSAPLQVTTTVQLRHRVTRSRWFELLEQAGTAVAINLLVPSPLTDPTPPDEPAAEARPSASQAARRLRQARQALADGDHERCVQTCRRVLEHVRTLQRPTSVSVLRQTDPSQRDADQRWSALFHDAYSLTSAASHDDENTLHIEWAQADAQAILALTTGLLARVSPHT